MKEKKKNPSSDNAKKLKKAQRELINTENKTKQNKENTFTARWIKLKTR